MAMEMNFGFVAKSRTAAAAPAVGAPFRIALLGDFSGAANTGRLDTGDALAARKPLRVDVDNIEKLFTRLAPKLTLPLGEGGEGVSIPLQSIDDFHPDQLYENVELFSALADLRRRVQSKNQFPAAAKEVYGWLGEDVPPLAPTPIRARGTSLPKSSKLSDFAALIGREAPAPAEEASVDSLVQSIIKPYLEPSKDPRQDQVLAIVDRALGDTMSRVLHHPDFQTLEAIWRSVDLMTRSIETNTKLQLVMYDITAEELAADLSSTDSLEDTGLYKLLVEQPALDESQGALSALLGFYTFELTPPQAELLGRAAAIGAMARAPFLAGVSLEALVMDPDEIHPLVKQAWDALRAQPVAQYLGLALPRFMLRQPYGEKTDPIDSFDYEEFTRRSGLASMLWANPVTLVGILMAQTFGKQGWKLNLGSILSLGGMPHYFYRDEDDDVTALPCTERLLTEKIITWIRGQHFMPVVSIKGRPEVRLGGFVSVHGEPLAGKWGEAKPVSFAKPGVAPAPATAPVPRPEPEGIAVPADAVADDNLDALLNSLEAPIAETSAPAEESSGDDDLDALLKSLEDPEPQPEPPPAAADSEDMDPELAELLKGL